MNASLDRRRHARHRRKRSPRCQRACQARAREARRRSVARGPGRRVHAERVPSAPSGRRRRKRRLPSSLRACVVARSLSHCPNEGCRSASAPTPKEHAEVLRCYTATSLALPNLSGNGSTAKTWKLSTSLRTTIPSTIRSSTIRSREWRFRQRTTSARMIHAKPTI